MSRRPDPPPTEPRTPLRSSVWTRSSPRDPPTMRRPAIFLLVAATVVVLGANWPIMAVGLEHVTPLWLASFRIDAAAVVVIVLLSARGRLRIPAGGDRAIWLSVGLVQTGLVTALVFVALQVVPPGRSSIIAYTSALWAIPLAVRFLGERLTAARGAGVAIGTLGLVVLLQPWALDWGDARLLVGTAMLLVGAIATAATTVHVRGHRWVRSPMDLMPWQLGLAAIPLTALALVVESARSAVDASDRRGRRVSGGAGIGVRHVGAPDDRAKPSSDRREPQRHGRPGRRPRGIRRLPRRTADGLGGRRSRDRPRRRHDRSGL